MKAMLNTDDDAVYEECLRQRVEHSTAYLLADCPLLAPLPAQVRLLHGVVGWARTRGCRLPRFRVYWKRGRQDIAAGACANSPQNGEYAIYLDATRFPLELQRTIAHELMHLHDFASGKTFSRVELERRADRFAAAFLA